MTEDIKGSVDQMAARAPWETPELRQIDAVEAEEVGAVNDDGAIGSS